MKENWTRFHFIFGALALFPLALLVGAKKALPAIGAIIMTCFLTWTKIIKKKKKIWQQHFTNVHVPGGGDQNTVPSCANVSNNQGSGKYTHLYIFLYYFFARRHNAAHTPEYTPGTCRALVLPFSTVSVFRLMINLFLVVEADV